jgi:hypothetical protein
MRHLLRRLVPQSIARQSQHAEPSKKVHVSRARFVDVIINRNVTRINARCLPSDLPTVEEWHKKRIWSDELEGRSLTL